MMTVDEELRAMMQTLTDQEAEMLEQMIAAPADRLAEERVCVRVMQMAQAAKPIGQSSVKKRRRIVIYAGTAAACLAAMISVVMYQRTRLTVPETVPAGEPAVTGTAVTTEFGAVTETGSGTVISTDDRYTQTGISGSTGTAVTTQTAADPSEAISVIATGSEERASEAGQSGQTDGESGSIVSETAWQTGTYASATTTAFSVMTSATTYTTPVPQSDRSGTEPPAGTTNVRSTTTWYSTGTTYSATVHGTLTELADTTTAASETTVRAADGVCADAPECRTAALAVPCAAAFIRRKKHKSLPDAS